MTRWVIALSSRSSSSYSSALIDAPRSIASVRCGCSMSVNRIGPDGCAGPLTRAPNTPRAQVDIHYSPRCNRPNDRRTDRQPRRGTATLEDYYRGSRAVPVGNSRSGGGPTTCRDMVSSRRQVYRRRYRLGCRSRRRYLPYWRAVQGVRVRCAHSVGDFSEYRRHTNRTTAHEHGG